MSMKRLVEGEIHRLDQIQSYLLYNMEIAKKLTDQTDSRREI